MKKKLFLHIGTNKTGTSAIQRFCNENREKLKSHGVLYPIAGCSGEAHYSLSHALGFALRRAEYLEREAAETASIAKALAHEVAASRARTVLISCENFVLPRPLAPVKQFFDQFDVKIVLYLRRHDHWWESVYNQAVKTVTAPPWGQSFGAYLRFQKQKNPTFGNYRHLLDRWAQTFGKENILVRPYERSQNAPDIVYDLFRTIGLESVVKQSERRSERINESIPHLALRLIDLYQRLDVDPDVRARLIQHAMQLPPDNPRVSVVRPALRRHLVDKNMADYEYIAREYLGRSDGMLFYEPLPDPAEPWKKPPAPDPVKLVEETVKALVDKAP